MARGVGSLQLGLWVVVILLTWVLGSKRESSEAAHLTKPPLQLQELDPWHTRACELEEGQASKQAPVINELKNLLGSRFRISVGS